jgi:hypothetical protein
MRVLKFFIIEILRIDLITQLLVLKKVQDASLLLPLPSTVLVVMEFKMRMEVGLFLKFKINI